MGDPTDRPKNSTDAQDNNQDGNVDEDNLDLEAEEVEPARNGLATGDGRWENVREHRAQNRTGSYDTVASILTSISNPEAAVVIPLDSYSEGDAEYVDPDRIEKFYSGALSAITKMRRETNKSHIKNEALRDEVGREIIDAWTTEHSEEVLPSKPAS